MARPGRTPDARTPRRQRTRQPGGQRTERGRTAWARASPPAGREQLGDVRTGHGLHDPAVELYLVILAEDPHALGIPDGGPPCGQDREYRLGLGLGLGSALGAALNRIPAGCGGVLI